ncbi:hypothetical protein DFS33DRAFT_1275086 [Desarmillaria ectypa]|nr:hypothetical protein DFS33DRAFT_1275086 [Desarmillaria ectypa]
MFTENSELWLPETYAHRYLGFHFLPICLKHEPTISYGTLSKKEIFELRESLNTLQELVEHPKAADYLRAARAYHHEARPESSSEDRWAEVCRRLKMPEGYDDPNELIYGLTHFNPPHYGFGATWETGLVEPGLIATTSLFYNHFRILRNEPIPKRYQLPDPLPLGEPVSYQIMLHGRIKLVVIEMDTTRFKFTLHDQEPLNLRVYGLLSDTVENAFFSYDPATTMFEKDENVWSGQIAKCWYSKEDLPKMRTRIDAATIKPCDRTLPDLLAGAVQDAKLATEKLIQHSDEDALKVGLHLLRKSLWVLPLLAETTNHCWLGLYDDLDQMAMKAASDFRREQIFWEKRWKDQEGHKTYKSRRVRPDRQNYGRDLVPTWVFHNQMAVAKDEHVATILIRASV